MPKASVIMPAYNAERYLEEAIESVLSQTLADWELIVVDDGSTDSTPQILLTTTDARIHTIRQANRGPAAARNIGLDKARGEYVGFLDADDLYLPHALADLVGYLDSHLEYDVVYSDGMMCDKDQHPLLRLSEHRPGIYTGHILDQIILSSSVVAVPVCTLTRRRLIQAKTLRFDEDLRIAEDSHFWVQAARYAGFGYLDRVTCMYRIHETNTSRTINHEAMTANLYLSRSKIMNSEWFNEISLETQVQFLHTLLAGVLSGQPSHQLEVMVSPRFLSLPASHRARLCRMVATTYLLQRQEPEFAEDCLLLSIASYPDDRKSQALLGFRRLGPWPRFFALSIWRQLHRAGGLVRSIGKRKPKPVPAALRRSGNG